MRDLKYRETKRAKSKNSRRHAMNAERVKMPVVKGDTVRVMRGNDKGKEGKIIRVHTKTGRIVVEGVAMVKKHRKARTADEQSGIIDFPAAIHHSNVMLLDPSTGEPTRVRARLADDGTEARVSAQSGEQRHKIGLERCGD